MKIGDKVKIVRSHRSTSMQSSSIVGKIGTIKEVNVFTKVNSTPWHKITLDGFTITMREDELERIKYTNMYDELEVTLNG